MENRKEEKKIKYLSPMIDSKRNNKNNLSRSENVVSLDFFIKHTQVFRLCQIFNQISLLKHL